MTWVSLNPNQLLPTGFTASVSSMTSLLNEALGALAALTIPPLPSVGGPNPAADAAQALLNVVSGLLQAGRLQVLAIPITKTFPDPPAPPLPPTFNDLQNELNTALGPSTTANASAYSDMILRSGGNAGFFNTFAASLFDTADNNRPQYGPDDAVVMGVLLAGASSFAQIYNVAQTLNFLIAPQAGASMTARVIPVPQGTTAKVVASSTGGPGIGVQVSWAPPAPGNTGSPYFPGVVFSVNRYALIRSTDPKIMTAQGVTDLFSTSPITQGLTDGANTVVSIGSGSNSSYLDTSLTLPATQPYYYAVAWEVISVESGTKTTMTFDKLSSVSKVMPVTPAPQQTGQSPNWQATQSAIGSIPPLARAIQTLVTEGQILLTGTSSPTSKLTSAIQLAQGATQRIAARAQELAADVNRLSAQLGHPLPALYATSMSSINGGNAYLVAQLSNLLNDTTDPNTPPYNNGEYVCGVCLVSGAPRIADLATVIAFIESLFGSSSPGAQPPNSLMGVLNAIDTAVTAAEAVFDPTMKPFPAGTDTSNIDPNTGAPIVTSYPVISDSGQGVTATDPNNPNAGFTNELNPSDLC